jgi:protein SCO1/2
MAGAIVAVAIVVLGGTWLGHRLDPTWGAASGRGLIPAFRAFDQEGRLVTEDDLTGRLWIADFIFTRCSGRCPLLSARLATLRRQVPSERIRFISFSIDPDYDRPPVLKTYAAHFGPPDPRWRLLATDEKTLEAITAAAEDARDAGRFVLVDAKGRVRGTFASDELGTIRQRVNALQF